MIIPIHLTPGALSTGGLLPPQLARFGTEELVLIEMQGTLEAEGSTAGQSVGKLTIDDVTNKATLLIGHHLLEGSLVKLPKPLAVLHRPQRSLPQDDDGDTQASDDARDWSGASKAEHGWDILAVVKRKMVFSKRPMPMVAST